MSSHHLLSSSSRDFSLVDVVKMTEADATALFCLARWPGTNGAARCPRCQASASGPDKRGRYRCKMCDHSFTLTSNTAFHGVKLSLTTLLVAVAAWSMAVKGMASLQIARVIGVNYRSAFRLMHRLRYVLALECLARRIGGPGKEVIIDSLYVGGRRRKANWHRAREKPGAAAARLQLRRAVIAAREVDGRIILCVRHRESEAIPFLLERIRPGSIIHADESPAWNILHAHYEMRRINHSKSYSDGQACTNLIESFFARVRRLHRGQHHYVSPQYLEKYAIEAAFREDNRHLTTKELTMRLLTLALNAPPEPHLNHAATNKSHPRRRRPFPGRRR